MSAISPEGVDARRYGGVNGNDITLTEKRTWANNKVIEFKLRNDSVHGIQLNLLLFCLALFLGNLTDSLIIVTLSAVALALHCKNITTSIDFDTLLVVESVGIQISSKKIFSGFNSSQFLPWTTVEDVFVNEVITGQRVLYFLTFLVKESVNGEERTRLVPLFRELKPSKECLEYIDYKEFLYEDELMKLIRRIIKCQPNQGQLSTAHLSITYKHTFWTRQDKMFAMLKFRNRQGAAVYPQAFILTISIVDNADSQVGGVVIKADPNLDCKNSSPTKALPNSPNPLNGSVPRQTEDNKDFKKLLEPSHSHQDSICPTITATDIISCQTNLIVADSDGLSNASESPGDTTTSWTSDERRRCRQNAYTNSIESNPMERYNHVSESDEAGTNVIVGNGLRAYSRDFFNVGLHSESCETSNSQAAEEIEETGTDSAPITPRSSNITDQVMEGLMFTIKQVEDNIKVVEQKTKMELDEVLENSEKVETKEGERCLVNSSLLRLENLVTKIELPDNRLRHPKTTHTASVIDSLTLLSDCSVPVRNGFSTAGCLAAESPVERQIAVPVSGSSQSPSKSSFESKWDNRTKDRVLDNLFQSSDGLTRIELPNVTLADGADNTTKEFQQNSVRPRKRQLASQEIAARGFRKAAAVHANGSSSDSDDGDNNNNNNNNDNNNNNNNDNSSDNSLGISNGQVQIDMWKLLQDITRGAKVMVERISEIDIRNATRPSTVSISVARGPGRRRNCQRRGRSDKACS